jgi:hypothetical protein
MARLLHYGVRLVDRIHTETDMLDRIDQQSDALDQRMMSIVDQRVQTIQTQVREEERRVAGYRERLASLESEAATVVGNLILGQFRAVQVQLYQIVMRADLGLVDVAWEQREEHNNRARMLAEEQNREISALNDEFSEVTEGAAPEDSQRLNNRSNAPSEPQSPPPPSTPQTGTTPAPVPGGTSAPTPPQAPTGEPQGQTR